MYKPELSIQCKTPIAFYGISPRLAAYKTLGIIACRLFLWANTMLIFWKLQNRKIYDLFWKIRDFMMQSC